MAPSHASPGRGGPPQLSTPRRARRSAPDTRWAVLGVFSLLFAGCRGESPVVVSLTAHAIPGCRPLPREARLELGALGEFPESLRSRVSIPLDTRDADLAIPAETLAIEARASFGDEHFLGFAEREGQREVPLLLWSEEEVCTLAPEPPEPEDASSVAGAPGLEGPRYPVAGGGQAIGYSKTSRTLLIAGGSAEDEPSASVSLLAFDAGSGEARVVASASDATLAEARAFASVTPFGTRLLVAGGENPIHGAERATPRGSAEIFDPSSGRVEPELIQLQEERTQHAATVLPNGDTLLVGGRGAFGDALRVLEAVSPQNGQSSIGGLASLAAARVSPTLLRLDDGRLFVGGGTAADDTPLSALEWFSADASQRLAAAFPPELPPRHNRAFAALPGGGVLIVGGCEEPAVGGPGADCSDVCGAARGCPPVGGYDLWWVDATGALTRFDLDFNAPRPVLLDGGDGRPWLVSGDPTNNVLRRFNPWRATFEETDLSLASLPRHDRPSAALDTQAFAWVVEDAAGNTSLVGARLGTRSRYARDVSLIADVDPEDPTRPPDLVPDRPLAGQVSYDGALLHFVAASEVKVFVAATDYADVTVTLEIEPGGLPRVVLGSQEFGGESCPWPEPVEPRLVLRRLGTRVVLSSGPLEGQPQTMESDGGSVECSGPDGRVRIGIRGGTDQTDVRRLDLRRGG